MNNNIEYEAKILDINQEDILKKLKKLGAKKVGEYKFRRYVFDTIPKKETRWVRLRSNGIQSTLTVKEIQDTESIGGTNEWEVIVSDLDTALIILKKIGIEPRGYQENLRTEYSLGGVEVSIDTWPRLEPYLEIEAKNEQEVISAAKQLGFSKEVLTSVNTEDLYHRIGIDLKKLDNLQF